MKKSILTIALAVMLVFAFTACNNTAPTSPLFGKQIQGVSLVSAPDYVAGETLDASAVTLKVNFDDNTSMNFKGSELGLTMSGALAAGSNAATATIADLEYTVNINAYAIEGFNIDISTIKADTVVRDATTVPSNGATIDVVYNGGKAKTAPEAIVSADTTLQGMVNIPVEAFGIDWDENIKEGAKFTMTVPADMASQTIDKKVYTFSGSKTITVVEAATATFSNFKIEQTNEVFTVAGDSNAKNTLSAVEYKGSFTLTDADGESSVVKFSSDEMNGWTLVFPEYHAEGVKLTKASETFPVKLTNSTYAGLEVTGELDVKTTADYPVTITVAAAEGHEDDTYKAGAAVPAGNFTFTASGAWASGKTYSGDEASKNNLSSSLFEADNVLKEQPDSATAGTPDYDVQFRYKTLPGTASITISPVEIEIKN